MTIFDTIRSAFRGGASAQDTSAAGVPNATNGLASPWADASHLEAVVWADLLDGVHQPVTRSEAQGVPAIARSRHILTSDASRCPLTLLDAEDQVLPAGWLQRSALGVSPQHRMVWTVDDLIHYGWSLWLARREEASTEAPILDSARCPWEWWEFGQGEQAGSILVKGKPVPDYVAILIPGFHDGILATSPRTIRAARELEVAAAQRAANPIPAVELHQTTPDTMTKTERRELVAEWVAALRENGGSVGYTPMSLQVIAHGAGATNDLLIEGRNAAAVDGARAVGVSAAMVDASGVNSTLTYETMQGRNLEYVDRSLALYLGPIDARLSLDDVTPAGTRVRADTSALTATLSTPTGTPTED